MSETSTLISCTGRITRAELAKLPTPPATETHIPIPHAAVVETLVETLSHRQISVVGEEFAVSKDDMEMFGVLDLETSFEGCRFAIGIRNANNKRFRLACTVGLRVFVCHNLAFRGDYSPVLAKHSKHFSLEDALSIGVDRMQRNFEPLRRQVESWQAEQLSAEVAKLTIYRAFIEGDLEVPRHLARRVHELYFNPQHEEFQPRTMWSLSNAFTSAFKELDPIPQFRATAKLGLERSVTVGQNVETKDQAFVVGDLTSMWVQAVLNERDLPQIQLGILATVRVQTIPGDTFTGQVAYIGEQVDEKTRTIPIRIVVKNRYFGKGQGFVLRPGLFTAVELQLSRKRDALVIPEPAVQTESGESFVFVQASGGSQSNTSQVQTSAQTQKYSFRKRPVVLGAHANGNVEVVKGLVLGEKVVVGNAYLLKGEMEKSNVED